MANIGTLLPRHAQYRPDKTAVVIGDLRLTYRLLNARVNQMVYLLQASGIRKGDKIATILPNCCAQLQTFWAAAKLGAVVVPLSPLLRGRGLSRLLQDADAVMVITDSGFGPHLDMVRAELAAIPAENFLLIDGQAPGYRSLPELASSFPTTNPPTEPINGGDPFNIIYSSGTTGLPKGIVHTHDIRAAYCTSFSAAYRITPESIILHTGSLVFNGAFLTLMPALFQGCTFILHPQFDPAAFITTVATEKVTHVVMVPSQIIAVLHHPDFDAAKLGSLEMICSVGAPLHLEHKEALNRQLPGRFYELYGLTEGFVTILDKYEYAQKPSAVGAPPPLFEMRIERPDGTICAPGEVGEIVGRGPILMAGYYKRPDLTAQAIVDGWLHSGDLGHVDKDGYLYLVDRQKDMIISGGVNVYPRDIEERLVQHPAVREAAVFGIPDEKWGETPVAAVILHAEQPVTAAELQEWLNARVEARYQKVAQVIIMEDFPRSVSGKTLKRVIRQPFWAGQESII